MPNFGILLVSNRSPRSIWNLAIRIEREVAGARIKGIVLERPTRDYDWLGDAWDRVVEFALSVAHAYPCRRNTDKEFGVAWLSRESEQRGWKFLCADERMTAEVQEFVRNQNADLGVMVGSPNVDAITQSIPRHGTIAFEASVRTDAATSGDTPQPSDALDVTIEPAFDVNAVSRRISATFPSQPYDTRAAVNLKTELFCNDLAVRTIEAFSNGSAEVAEESIAAWANSLPRFTAEAGLNAAAVALDPSRWRNRSARSLFLHTLALFSPIFIARNWYRRWRGQFPVVILFHHLVSDRPHRMGMPTEIFYREVEFLQKYYRVVSVSEAAMILKSGSVTAPTVVLTFDDGYEDNYVNLRAISEACGVPVSLFVSTAAIDSHAEFQHDLRRGTKGFRALSWDQVRSWQSNVVEFGSHTRTHFNCGSTDLYALETEIIGSSDDMQNRLGARPRFFAFPWGKAPNMSAPAIEIATSCYDVCFSTLAEENFAGNGTPHKVAGRKGLPATVWELELTVQSVFEFAQSLRSREKNLEDSTPSPMS